MAFDITFDPCKGADYRQQQINKKLFSEPKQRYVRKRHLRIDFDSDKIIEAQIQKVFTSFDFNTRDSQSISKKYVKLNKLVRYDEWTSETLCSRLENLNRIQRQFDNKYLMHKSVKIDPLLLVATESSINNNVEGYINIQSRGRYEYVSWPQLWTCNPKLLRTDYLLTFNKIDQLSLLFKKYLDMDFPKIILTQGLTSQLLSCSPQTIEHKIEELLDSQVNKQFIAQVAQHVPEILYLRSELILERLQYIADKYEDYRIIEKEPKLLISDSKTLEMRFQELSLLLGRDEDFVRRMIVVIPRIVNSSTISIHHKWTSIIQFTDKVAQWKDLPMLWKEYEVARALCCSTNVIQRLNYLACTQQGLNKAPFYWLKRSKQIFSKTFPKYDKWLDDRQKLEAQGLQSYTPQLVFGIDDSQQY